MDAGGRSRRFRGVAPDFVGGKGQQRCNQAHQSIVNLVEGRLSASASRAGRTRCVEPVFDDQEIESAQIGGSEIVNRTIDSVELQRVIPTAAATDQVLCAR